MRDMDAFVAKKIMRWSNVHIEIPSNDWVGIPPDRGVGLGAWLECEEVPMYTCHLSSAWTVVQEMKNRGFLFGMTWQRMEGEGPFLWEATFQKEDRERLVGVCNSFENEAFAICMAAMDCLGLVSGAFDDDSPVRVSSYAPELEIPKA
jgi:hypothetical protein